MCSVGLSSSEVNIVVHNNWSEPIAYRVRVSVKNMFAMPDPGLLRAGEVKYIPVAMNARTDHASLESLPKTKFLVQCLPVGNYSTLPKGFWEAQSAKAGVMKNVGCEYEALN